MATRFTRLSVVAGDQQLDASLPASRPVAEFMAHVPAMFSLRPTTPPTAWALSSPRHGLIALERSLEEVGVVDGDVLYLSPALEAAESPVVEDVLTAISDLVEDRIQPWRGTDRDRVISCLVGVLVVTLALALARAPGTLASGVLLLAGALALFLLGTVRGRGGLGGVAWASPLYAALAQLRLGQALRPEAHIMAAVAAGLLALAATAALRHQAPVVAGSVIAGVGAGVATVALGLGVDGSAVAAWAAPGLVLALGVLPQFALTVSGLVGLVHQSEQDIGVSRSQLTMRAAVTSAGIEGAVAAIGAAGATGTAILVWSGRPSQAALGLLLGLIFTLRSRAFATASQVGYLLTAAVAAVSAAAFALPKWLAVTAPAAAAAVQVAALCVALTLVATAGYVRLREVGAARLTRLLDLLDALAVLSLVPAVLLAQNLFGWLAHRA